MNIQKYCFYILLIFTGLLSQSCKKFFEVNNTDRNTLPKTFSTITGFKAALAGTYTTMYTYYANEFYRYPDAAGNMTDIRFAIPGSMMPQHNFESDPEQETQAVGYIWRKIFVTITNANNIIENHPIYLDNHPGDQSILDTIKAQALFIRALAHFDLCRVYAQPFQYTSDGSHTGVPVVLVNPTPEEAVSRKSVKAVYQAIMTDLKEAEKLFGNTQPKDAYFASKKATQALMARVSLYAGNWDDAIGYATTVINSSQLAMGADYAAMFNNLIPGVEAIFRLNGQLQPRGLSLSQVYSIISPNFVPADTLMKLFSDPTDIRLNLFQKDPNNGTKYFTKKWYIGVPFDGKTESYDPMVLRNSEMYFIRAEANLNKNNLVAVANDLKIILGRATGKAPQDVVLTETDKAILDRTLTEELAKEFCFEGQNFFNITRRKQNLVRGSTTTSTEKKLNYPNNKFVLPIPQSELDANPGMIGNPTVNK